MRDTTRIDLSKYRLEKAEAVLKTAKRLLDDEDYASVQHLSCNESRNRFGWRRLQKAFRSYRQVFREISEDRCATERIRKAGFKCFKNT